MTRSFLAIVPLLAMTAAASGIQAVRVVTGVPPGPSSGDLGSFGFSLALVLWVVVDARRRRCVPCYDFGFLVAVFLPLSLVWYAFWSRGWKGLILLAAVLGLAIAPDVFSALVRVALGARA